MRYGIAIDTSRCMACYNCFMACKDEHVGYGSALTAPQPHQGHTWMNIDQWERGDKPGNIKTCTVPTPCLHCQDPACVHAAKNGGAYRREDGIVILDPEKAKGQRAIQEACPVGAIYWNDDLDIPQKCTMCAELLDQGYAKPRCVEACPNQALRFGDLDDPNSEVSQAIAAGQVTPLKAQGGKPCQVVHLNIPQTFLGGAIYLPNDEVAIGATVKITDIATGTVYETQTNWAGDFLMEGLTVGNTYAVKISLDGYATIQSQEYLLCDHFMDDITMTPQ